jgi:hypothetical protein
MLSHTARKTARVGVRAASGIARRARRLRLFVGPNAEILTGRRRGQQRRAREVLAQGFVPMFFLLRQVSLRKRLDIAAVRRRAPGILARALAAELGRRWLPPGAAAPRLDLHRSPHWGRGREAAQANLAAAQQEAERLAYVAATRARQLLVLGWRAAEAGDYPTARALQTKLGALSRTLFATSSPIPVKEGMSLLGLCGPGLRLPLVSEPKVAESMKVAMAAYGGLLGEQWR